MSTWNTRIGDARQTVTVVLSDQTGAVDLTGATVQFQAQLEGTTIIGAATPNVDQSAHRGEVSYELTTSNLAVGQPVGAWRATWQVTFTDGTVATWPRPGYDTLNVERQLA